MAIAKWAAAAVTLLMALANLGQIAQGLASGWKVVGVVLGVAGVAAVGGLIARPGWGRSAVLVVGALNLIVAGIAGIAGLEGWPIGVVLSALAIALGAVYTPKSEAASPATTEGVHA